MKVDSALHSIAARGRKAFPRVLAILDQSFVSAANFVLAVALARLYLPADFAGYGIGLGIALTLGGAYRTSFAVPNALLEERTYKVRAKGLSAQHIMVLGSIQMLALLAFFGAHCLGEGELVQASLLSLVAVVPLYLSLENDRIFALRSGWILLPGLLSAGMASMMAVAILCAWQFELSFFTVLTLLAVTTTSKTLVASLLPGVPDFRHGVCVLRHRLRHTVGWTMVGTVASAGYSHAPQWILAMFAPTINVAAYTAMRTPLQPMQIIVRSLDIVDKVAFSRIARTNRDARRRHVKRSFGLYLGMAAALMLTLVVFASPLVRLILGERYLVFVPTLYVWGVSFVLQLSTAPLETLVYDARQYRAYAMAQLVGGATAVAIAVPLSIVGQDFGAAAACVVGLSIPYVWLLAQARKLA